MLSRRHFLQSFAVSSTLPYLWSVTARGEEKLPRKKLAIICTVWHLGSHAQHMGDRFLTGYPWQGEWHQPALDVVSVYVDQKTEKDVSAERSAEFGFPIYPTIAEALCCGGKELAVDAVLVIGEHGDYPLSPIGQKKYPRYEFFKQITDVYRASGRTAPVFNDKHLSWNFEWAREMVALSKELNFGFCAGSSLPVTWRLPDVDVPLGAPLKEAMVISPGPVDIYDFHALESLQCLVERRAGGETGVRSIQGLRGPAVWKALHQPDWNAGGWDPALFMACLSRSHTLAQAHSSFGHRLPTADEIQNLCPDPVSYRIEYRDGLRATMLLASPLVSDFNVAIRFQDERPLLSTQLHLPPRPNVAYSTSLMHQAEITFLTGKSPSPIERTLLTSGLVTAGMTSLAEKSQVLPTPQLAIAYQPPAASQYVRD